MTIAQARKDGHHFLLSYFAYCLGEMHGCLFQCLRDPEVISHFAQRGLTHEDLQDLNAKLNDFAAAFYAKSV